MTRMMILGGMICFTAMFTACAPEPAEESHSGTEQNMKAEALRTLREADRSWSRSAPDLEAFMSFIADDVVWLFCSRSPIIGKDKVRSHYEKAFANPGLSLTWMPDRIDVSDAGDMGYAFGAWKASAQDSSGHLSGKTGYYATVWRKRSGSDWKVVLEADY